MEIERLRLSVGRGRRSALDLDVTNTPHDAYARRTFQRPALAAEQILFTLGPRIAASIEPGSLELVPGTFITEDMRDHETDCLYQARIRGLALIYVLLEHMSRPHRWMALRILGYLSVIWKEFVRQNPDAERLPMILPIVLHHGERAWPHPTAFESLLDLPADLDEVRRLVPHFEFVLDDLATQTDEQLRSRPVSAHLRMVLMALQSARSARSLRELFVRLGGLVEELQGSEAGWAALGELFRYLFHVRPRHEAPDFKRVAAGLRGSGQEELMQTIAEMYIEQGHKRGRREGRQEGRQEGLQEGLGKALQRLLRARFGRLPAWVSARVRASDERQLMRWMDRLLGATTLDDVFA